MSNTSEASDFSQRLIGQMQSSCPSLLPILGQSIDTLGRNSQDIDTFRKQFNRVLRTQLTECKEDTMELRILLDDYDRIEFWRMNLINKVLPFMVKNLK